MELLDYQPNIRAVSVGVAKLGDIAVYNDNATLALLQGFGFRPLAVITETGYVIGISNRGGVYLVNPLLNPLVGEFKTLIGGHNALAQIDQPGVHVEYVEMSEPPRSAKATALRIVLIDPNGKYLVNALVTCPVQTL